MSTPMPVQVLDWDEELKKNTAKIDAFLAQFKSGHIKDYLTKLFKSLNEDSIVKGDLPPGFLYCMGCARDAYQGMVRFFAFSARECSGRCVTCGMIHVITPKYLHYYHDNARPETRSNPLPFDDTDLWDHVRAYLSQQKIA